MVLVNTWGDRGQDTRIGADFVMRELDACAQLGATHLQLDDGWQQGQSSNSASAGGSLAGIWQGRNDYWGTCIPCVSRRDSIPSSPARTNWYRAVPVV